MTVQISLRKNDWIIHAGPWFGPFVSWVDVFKYLDILTLEFSITRVHHLFWPGCKLMLRPLVVLSIPGSFDIMSITFASGQLDTDISAWSYDMEGQLQEYVWIQNLCRSKNCEADDPCSINTASEPESSLTVSPRSTPRPLYFWNCGSDSEILRWQRSINDAKWTVISFFPLLR